MAVADEENSLLLTGNGDVEEPEDESSVLGLEGLLALSAAIRLCMMLIRRCH